MNRLLCLGNLGRQALSFGRRLPANSPFATGVSTAAPNLRPNYATLCQSQRALSSAAPTGLSVNLSALMSKLSLNVVGGTTLFRRMSSLWQLHIHGPHKKIRRKKRPLDGRPQMKGVVLKTLIKKPRKPNSANRKCVLVRLSNGKEMVAHVPGEGHNLQEHNIVLVRVGRLQDTPGVKLKVIRGKYDCAHVIKKTQVTK